MPRRRLTRAESQVETRERLLEAAARVFRRNGYERASVGRIADEAGYTHGAVYSNFESKEDLFLALYERWVAARVSEIESEWNVQAGLAERARAVIEDWIRWLNESPEAFLLRLEFVVRAPHDRKLRRQLGTRVAAVPLAIQRLIEDAGGDDLALSIPIEHAALGFQALSLGLALEEVSNPGSVTPQLAGELADRLFAGLQAPAGRSRR